MADDMKEKYINPYTDFGFKKLFGTEMNKDRIFRVTSKILCLIVNKNQKEPFSMYVALAELS